MSRTRPPLTRILVAVGLLVVVIAPLAAALGTSGFVRGRSLESEGVKVHGRVVAIHASPVPVRTRSTSTIAMIDGPARQTALMLAVLLAGAMALVVLRVTAPLLSRQVATRGPPSIRLT